MPTQVYTARVPKRARRFTSIQVNIQLSEF